MPYGPKTLHVLNDDLSQLVPIPDRPGYYASPSGDIFCVRKMSVYRDRDGYARVNLSVAGKKMKNAVHTLLARTFTSEPCGDEVIRHLDGNRQNNSLGNLRWGTVRENAADTVFHGSLRGERNPRAKLSVAQVMEIKNRISQGESQSNLAAEYGVSKSTVNAINIGDNWRHVG
jgi:hypothetical protein